MRAVGLWAVLCVLAFAGPAFAGDDKPDRCKTIEKACREMAPGKSEHDKQLREQCEKQAKEERGCNGSKK